MTKLSNPDEDQTEADVNPHKLLEKIRNYPHAPYLDEALALLVSSLCGHNPSDAILEYTSFPFLLSTRIAETDAARRLSVVATDRQFTEILRTLFAKRGLPIFESLRALPATTVY